MQSTFFDKVERWGNRLPHPVLLFLWLSLLIAITSSVASFYGASYTLPGKELEFVQNLFTLDSIRQWIGGSVSAFINFPPLGIVIIVTIGIGLADSSGFIAYMVQRLVANTGRWQLTISIMILGVLSNLIGSVGYIVLIPLACRAYQAAGRPALAGLATAFAGVAGGTHATVFLTTYDVVIAGISSAAAQLIDPSYVVSPLANYFFMCASTVALVITGSYVSISFVEKRLSLSNKGSSQVAQSLPLERNRSNDKAMYSALAVVFISVAAVFLSVVLPNGWLSPREGQLLGRSEVIRGLPTLIAFTFGLSGIVFGVVSGTFKSESDLIKGCQKSLNQLGLFLLIMFAASQLIYLFKLSNLSGLIAVTVGDLISFNDLSPVLIVVSIVLLCAATNIFLGSPIVQWSLMAPVIIPSLFYAGIPIEVTQAAFRIGDSVTNIISPLFGYLGLILATAQDYDKEAKLGTLMSMMLPFSMAFLLVWTTLLVVWVFVLEFPLGV